MGNYLGISRKFDPDKYWVGYVLVACAVITDAFFLDFQAHTRGVLPDCKPSYNISELLYIPILRVFIISKGYLIGGVRVL